MTTPQLCLTCLVFLLYHCCHGGLLEPLALGGGRTPEVFSGRRAMVLVGGRAMVGMGGGARLFFSFLVSSLFFFFGRRFGRSAAMIITIMSMRPGGLIMS